MKLLLGLVAIASLQAAVTVTSVSVTATQATLKYTAPSTAVCTLEVSESATYTPLVPDVDPAIVADADHDDRAGNLGTGTTSRTFVIGHKDTVKVTEADGGFRYVSRALQSHTAHSYRISCGGDATTGTFTTGYWPFGLSFPDPVPSDPNSPGTPAWPTLSWQTHDGVIDPYTGAKIMRLSTGFYQMHTGVTDYVWVPFSAAAGSAWGNPAYALDDDTTAATYTGATQDVLVLTIPDPGYPLSGNGETTDAIRIGVKGCVDGGATGDDAAIEMAISMDAGVTAHTKWVSLSLPATCDGTEYYAGDASTPTTIWAAWLRDGYPPHQKWGTNTALMVRKKTTSTHQINLRYLVMGHWHSLSLGWNGGGGATRMCSERLTGGADSKLGHLCSVWGGYTYTYWIGLDGEIRYLGPTTGYFVAWDTSGTYDALYTSTSRIEYRGDYLDKSPFLQTWGSEWVETASISGDTLNARVAAFEPRCSSYGGLMGIQNGRLIYESRSIQNSLGCTIVTDTSWNVIAASPTYSDAPSRWCGVHTTNVFGPNMKWLNESREPLTSDYCCSGLGQACYDAHHECGPWYSTSQTAMTAGPFDACPTNSFTTAAGIAGQNKCSTVQIDGQPTTGYVDQTYLQDWAVGDYIVTTKANNATHFDPDVSDWGEILRVVDILTSPTRLVVQRAFDGQKDNQGNSVTTWFAHDSGIHLSAVCSDTATEYGWYGYWFYGGHVWWNFEDDPHATNPTGDQWGLETGTPTVMKETIMANMSHNTGRGSKTVSDLAPPFVPCSSTMYGTAVYGLRWSDNPITADFFKIDAPFWCQANQTEFAGVLSQTGWGNAVEHHPSLPDKDSNFFVDASPWNTPRHGSMTVAAVSGQLYKVTGWNGGGANENYKIRPPIVTSGPNRILKDISPGPITTGSGDSYKYCVASVAGDCYAGSVAQEVYVNVPTYDGGGNNCNTANDICVSMLPAQAHAWTQTLMHRTDDGKGLYIRRLTNALLSPRYYDQMYQIRAAGGSADYTFGPTSALDNVTGRLSLLLVKNPMPSDVDAFDRTTFLPITYTVTPPGGTDNVVVEFGYDPEFRCTARDEACVSVKTNSTWGADPFKWETAEAPITGVPCTAFCTVYIPMIPERMMYYRAVYRDSGNSVLGTGATMVTNGYGEAAPATNSPKHSGGTMRGGSVR